MIEPEDAAVFRVMVRQAREVIIVADSIKMYPKAFLVNPDVRSLMEIVGGHFGSGDIERNNSIGFDVDYSILILQRTFNLEEAAARNDDAIALKDVRGNDDIGDAGFIFEGKEDKSLGCAWPLPCDNTPGNSDKVIARSVTQIIC